MGFKDLPESAQVQAQMTLSRLITDIGYSLDETKAKNLGERVAQAFIAMGNYDDAPEETKKCDADHAAEDTATISMAELIPLVSKLNRLFEDFALRDPQNQPIMSCLHFISLISQPIDTEKPPVIGIFVARCSGVESIINRLDQALAPYIDRISHNCGNIKFKNGARIDFWATNNNLLAGRGRSYNMVLNAPSMTFEA